jgi:hypothetical protein
MGEKKRVNLRVHADTKDRWDQYVEESPQYSTLSQLIRTAVNQEISEDQADDQDDGTGGDGTDIDIEELTNSLDSIQAKLDEIDKQRTGRGQYAQPDVDAEKMFEALPDGEGPSDGETIGSLMEKTGSNSIRTSFTTNQLYEESGRVKRGENDDGEMVYWKEV